jgi:hypothetical protein
MAVVLPEAPILLDARLGKKVPANAVAARKPRKQGLGAPDSFEIANLNEL